MHANQFAAPNDTNAGLGNIPNIIRHSSSSKDGRSFYSPVTYSVMRGSRAFCVCLRLMLLQESLDVDEAPPGSLPWGFHSNSSLSSLDRSNMTLQQEVYKLRQTITELSHCHDLLSAKHETLK